METTFIIACLCSAFLHAVWNAAVKGSGKPAEVMTGQMIMAALLGLPLLVFVQAPDPSIVLWLAASSVANIISLKSMLKAYVHGDFGLVYPMTRAIIIMVVTSLSAVIAHDVLTAGAMVGIAMIVVSLITIALNARSGKHFPLSVLLWTGVAGVTGACSVLLDANGIRQTGSPFAYGCLAAITNASVMVWYQRKTPLLWHTMRLHKGTILIAGVLSMASYLLIVWVFSKAPIAGAAALRDTSAVFAVIIAMVFLKEKINPTKLIAICLAILAIPLIRLG